ncbi:hypothetical protein A7A08_02151 [Methyloligella halotolerans]|uniref:Uncharacterized protein n=1 Tax=Methyloligella halotolerans TaxID=1177755 RepID=A0A1E2RXA5_9HYPH|nr:hypothetical protein A7A08_02151 [Methyloligella halotolerans]
MTGRKGKPPPIIEDVSNASLQLRCPNPQCGHEFFKKGGWLEKHKVFGCPKCGQTISFNDEQLTSLFSEHVKNVRDMINRMRGK